MCLKITIFIADQSIKTPMNQSTSTVSKVTINKLSSTHTEQKKPTISFKLHIPHYRQGKVYMIKNLVDSLTEEIASLSRLGVHKQTYSYPCVEECRNQIMEALYAMGDAGHRHKLDLFIKADSCIRKGMSISETARQLGVHSQVVYRLVRHHTGKDYMSAQQKSILIHADELAWEISHGCTDIKKLKEKMEKKMQPAVVSSDTLVIRNSIKQAQREVRKYNRSIAETKNMHR